MAQETYLFRSPSNNAAAPKSSESVGRALDEMIQSRIAVLIMLGVFATALTAIEWYRWYQNMPPDPRNATAFMLLVWVICGWIFLRSTRRVRELKLQRAGQRLVGQSLERMRELGAQIFHDVAHDHASLDHVVISTHGIFIVQTAALATRPGETGVITVEQGKIHANNKPIDEQPVDQAAEHAQWLQKLLLRRTGRQFPIRSAVAFPGWHVQRVPNDALRGVWILNPKTLFSLIVSTPQTMSLEDVRLAAYHLSHYIRG